MPTHIRRFLVRFTIFAVVATILVLCLISGVRLWRVRRATTIAAKYAETGNNAQILRVLRLEHRWAPAYPAFSNTVADLHAQALRQRDPAATPPAPPERSFTAPIPLAEKMLIPADMLVNLLYRQYSARQQTDTGTAADAAGAEFRPGPEEQADRPATALHNPHQDEYHDVLRQYKAINDESKQLKADYEKATGSKRMELANRLRTLKNEQFVLMSKYRDLKQKKEDWERATRMTRRAEQTPSNAGN